MATEMRIYYNPDDHESLFGSYEPEGVNVEASIENLIDILEKDLAKAFPAYEIIILQENSSEMVYTDDDDRGEEIRPWVEGAISDIWSDMECWIIKE